LIAQHANALSNCVLYCTHLALGSCCINWLFCHSSPGEDAGKIISGSQDLHLAVLDNTDTYNILGPLHCDTDLGRKSPIFDQITHMHLTVTPHGPLLLTCLELFGRLSHMSVPYYFGGQHYIKNLHNFLRLQVLTILVVAMSDGVVQKGYWKKLEWWVWEVREMDGRVYLVEGCQLGGFWEEWENKVRGGEYLG
jgi:hypothetical protein